MNIAYRHVVLIGMMGSGKTTCGRLLAKRLGWGFWDCDEALMEATGSTAGELQRMRGQAVLHAIEHRLLRNALMTRTDTVFAAAGSAVLKPSVLQGELTVWLRASAVHENIAHDPRLRLKRNAAWSDAIWWARFQRCQDVLRLIGE